ncbi:acylphosphatase-1 [Anguilla anguilla]|uniref:acylphosphatase-1 n=1 Tax=Anguilla anguilla TaxID=7936 RepID=UPI0015AD3BD2|nr:acylphosphatase-1 [Anguilla anguilla]
MKHPRIRFFNPETPDVNQLVLNSRDSICFKHSVNITTMTDKEDVISVDYEIFGRVQGVFFRKYTQAEGKKLGLVGWVQNTEAGTVQGQLQGPSSKVIQMQEWLKTTGSPKSQIVKAEFKNERKIENLGHKNFKIIHP